MAIQSINTPSGSQPPRSTASTCTNGMAVYAPPKDSEPATSPSRNRCGRSGVRAMPRARETGEGGPPRSAQYVAYPP